MDITNYKDGKLDSIRNANGQWINTEVFREPARHFQKHGYYVADPHGSPAWFEYWSEQRRRCMKGFSVGGAKITGAHYFYLNFCPIMKVEDMFAKKSKKVKDFPDFWDGDYNYFWVREIAKEGVFSASDDDNAKEAVLQLDDVAQAVELKSLFEGLNLEVKIKTDYLRGGFNIIVGKSRRKGYSYKSAAVASNNYFTKPNSLTIFGAYEKKFLYPKGLFTMAANNIHFINEHSGWSMPSDVIQKQDHVKASYIQVKDGIKIEKGFKSELVALTFKDNPDAARGKDAEDIFFEESGAFGTPGLLKQSYVATQDCVMAGAIKTGMITIFGTSGDMEGGTADYADMFSRPQAFGLLPFQNIWDEGEEDSETGFFHPFNWNTEGFYDKQGNSDAEAARKLEKRDREVLIKNGATSTEIQKRMQEKPLGPAEAFATVSLNNFPVVELRRQLRRVKSKNWQETKGTPVELSRDGGVVKAKPILDGSVAPITSLYSSPVDKRGCPVIYEQPIPDAPRGMYKIGYDPVRQDLGSSLCAMVVYKGVHKGSYNSQILVAEYIGRHEDTDNNDRVAELLADLYNTTIMHENEVTGVKNYFRRIKRLNLLAAQPDAVISKNIQKSKVSRVYGCHMNLQLKDAAERYTKTWLLTVLDYDENGNPVTVIDKIYSIRMLEELISYNRKGNYDLCSALFMCMFQVQEESLDKEYDKPYENKNMKKLVSMMGNMYKKP